MIGLNNNKKFENDYATVLNYAKKKKYKNLEKAISNGFDVNQKNNWGISFFSNIVIVGDEDLIEICLKAGGDPFYSPQKYSESPFLFSLFRKKENILLLMLDYTNDKDLILKCLNIKNRRDLDDLIVKGIFNDIPLVFEKIKNYLN